MGPTVPGRRASTSSGRSSAGNSPPRSRNAGSKAVRTLVDMLVAASFAESKRAAQRLIAEGAVKIDGSVVTDPKAIWDTSEPAVLQVAPQIRSRPSEKG